jgi:hypothetical protein
MKRALAAVLIGLGVCVGLVLLARLPDEFIEDRLEEMLMADIGVVMVVSGAFASRKRATLVIASVVCFVGRGLTEFWSLQPAMPLAGAVTSGIFEGFRLTLIAAVAYAVSFSTVKSLTKSRAPAPPTIGGP